MTDEECCAMRLSEWMNQLNPLRLIDRAIEDYFSDVLAFWPLDGM